MLTAVMAALRRLCEELSTFLPMSGLLEWPYYNTATAHLNSYVHPCDGPPILMFLGSSSAHVGKPLVAAAG